MPCAACAVGCRRSPIAGGSATVDATRLSRLGTHFWGFQDEDRKAGSEAAAIHGEHGDEAHSGEERKGRKGVHAQVKKFNEMRREAKKAQLKVRVELSLTNRARNTLIVLVAIIILLTVFFEAAMDQILEATPRGLTPMVQSVFRELTLLGFISLFTFLAVKSTVPGKASRLIFGTADELQEMFEVIHFVVFFFMLFFVVLVILLVFGGCTPPHDPT